MDQEQVVLEIDPRSVHQAILQANKDVDDWEKGVVGAGERMQKSLERMADLLIKTNDRSYTSMERLTQSIERQAAMYAKNPVDRLIAERDRWIKKLGDEQAMVDRVTKAYGEMIDIASKKEGGGGGFEAFGQSVKEFIENPLEGAKEAASGLMEKMGPMGGVVAGSAAVLGAFAVAGYEAAKSLGEYGRQIENVHLRTGLAGTQVEQFAYAARQMGQDVNIFERMMRGLSETVGDSGERGNKARDALVKLGVDLRDVTGDLKPTSQLLLEISEGLAKIPEGMQRDAVAIEVFRRGTVEAIPVISKLSENIARAKELGLGATAEDLRRWEKYDQNVTDAEVIWERFVRRIKEPIAATIMFFFKDQQNRMLSIDDLRNMGVNVSGYAAATEGEWRSSAQAAGFNVGPVDEHQRQMTLDYLARIDQRRRTDEAIKGYYTEQEHAPEYRLKEAEAALAKMPKPEVGVTSQEDLAKYKVAAQRVESLKQLIEHMRQLEDAEKRLEAFEHSAYDLDKDPVVKAFEKRDELVKAGADWDRATSAAIHEANAYLQKTGDEVAKRWAELTSKAAGESAKFWEKEWDELYKHAAARAKAIGEAFKEHVAEVRAALADQDERTFGVLGATGKFAARMIGIQGKGGGDDASVLREQLAVREKVREMELAIKEKHSEIYDVDKERFKAELESLQDRYEYEEKIAEIKHKEAEEVERSATSLARTLLTKPADFPRQLASTIHEAFLKPITESIGGLASRALTPIIYGSDARAGLPGSCGLADSRIR